MCVREYFIDKYFLLLFIGFPFVIVVAARQPVRFISIRCIFSHSVTRVRGIRKHMAQYEIERSFNNICHTVRYACKCRRRRRRCCCCCRCLLQNEAEAEAEAKAAHTLNIFNCCCCCCDAALFKHGVDDHSCAICFILFDTCTSTHVHTCVYVCVYTYSVCISRCLYSCK